MNALQLEMKKGIWQKIKNGHYVFEKVGCLVCGSAGFETLAEKERYCLFMPVAICNE